jgi:hypothetical protein
VDGSKVIVGFTGTRSTLTSAQAGRLVHLLVELRTKSIEHVVHGDCVGADEEFDRICYSLHLRRELYPSDTPDLRAYSERKRRDGVFTHPAEPPLARNKKIVEVCHVLIACPKTLDEQRRSGTWTTVRAARAVKRPAVLIYPNGVIVRSDHKGHVIGSGTQTS